MHANNSQVPDLPADRTPNLRAVLLPRAVLHTVLRRARTRVRRAGARVRRAVRLGSAGAARAARQSAADECKGRVRARARYVWPRYVARYVT
jgi:hypothetical protein